MRTVIFVTAFAAANLLPNAGQVIFGAATTSARVNDTVKVGIYVDQADAGLSILNIAVPYTPGSLQYTGLEGAGLTATNVVISDAQGSVNVKWTGTLAAGDSRHLGYVKFTVRKADKSEFQGKGVNPTAKDSGGVAVTDINVLNSEAIVQLSPRPLRLQMDLKVE